MEGFLIYVIICLAPSMSCADMMGKYSFIFRSYESCKVFADKALEEYKKEARKRNVIFVDGIAFCLKFQDGKDI